MNVVTENLAWLVDDLVHRVVETRHAIILSADGLLMAASAGLDRDDAEHLAAAAAGLQSLARGAGRHFADSTVRRTMIEFGNGYLFITAAGSGACLAVVCGRDIDVGVAAYEMEMLVVRVGQYITSPARSR
ncbi:MAG TPA: roadblock/LC7 domain-containing protein [Nocardioides sp.]|nr:roadblock/LC7 domain-containing protein [Nocardioides sp.]